MSKIGLLVKQKKYGRNPRPKVTKSICMSKSVKTPPKQKKKKRHLKFENNRRKETPEKDAMLTLHHATSYRENCILKNGNRAKQ